MQPPLTRAADSAAMRMRFFMMCFSVATRADFARQYFAGRKKYTNREVQRLQVLTVQLGHSC
jgi:hypothetical protein